MGIKNKRTVNNSLPMLMNQSLPVSIRDKMELLPLSKTKDNADPVGLSQQLVQLKLKVLKLNHNILMKLFKKHVNIVPPVTSKLVDIKMLVVILEQPPLT